MDPSGLPLPVPGQVKYTGAGAWHPLTSSWVASTKDYGESGGNSACAYCCGTDRVIPVPQIMPQVHFLDKVVCARCCSMTVACGLTGQKTLEVPQLQCSDKGDDVPVVQVVVWVSWKAPQIQFIATRRWAIFEGSAAMLGWAFFALLRVVPELSASFRSP